MLKIERKRAKNRRTERRATKRRRRRRGEVERQGEWGSEACVGRAGGGGGRGGCEGDGVGDYSTLQPKIVSLNCYQNDIHICKIPCSINSKSNKKLTETVFRKHTL